MREGYPRDTHRLSLIVLMAAGLAVRLFEIGRESLWLDEAGRVAIASLPLAQIPTGVAHVELSPPLYHFLLHGWMRVAGPSDEAVRALSAVLVVPSIPVGWSLGRAVAGDRVGLAVAALVAASPFAVHYAQETAMYALLLLLSLAAVRAAVGVLARPGQENLSPREIVGLRSRWLVAYAAFGTLALYTHYYAAFVLAIVAIVGMVDLAARRASHGVALWAVTHAGIAVAFLPWLPVAMSQAALAGSVQEWTAPSLPDAVESWSAAILADGASVWPGGLGVALIVVGAGLGAWRLRAERPVAWLLVGLAVGPLALALLAAGFFHSFRERGLMAAVAAIWVLLAGAVFAGRPGGLPDRALRAGIGLGVLAATVAGVVSHMGEAKENWRGAAAFVAGGAGPNDPIFFVHYGAQLPFDRYFGGPQPRVGLPESFNWSDGYFARYRVTPEDVDGRVGPALAGQAQAWVVLSHEAGRGSEHLLAFLDRWGSRVSDYRVYGVRVLNYSRFGVYRFHAIA